MKENWESVFNRLIKSEGGYVDHPRDPGGATNLGITIGTLSAHLGRKATKVEVRALTKTTVEPIYKKNYWDKVKGDQLPSGVDYAVFDYFVNSGSRGVVGLQRVLGNIADDGNLGPITLREVKKRDPRLLIDQLCAERLNFLTKLKNWPTFGKGWKKRVEEVEATATKMVKE